MTGAAQAGGSALQRHRFSQRDDGAGLAQTNSFDVAAVSREKRGMLKV